MKKHTPIIEKLFNGNYQLIDGTDEIFELDLALWEYEVLSKKELVERSAYFKLVDGKETAHYKTCNLQKLEEVHKNSSFRTKIFFLDGKYSTGYATHGLFPYRGKFHPQLIRALLNILDIKPGHVVLDPMAGSSTVAVEANLLGIDAISVDLSPFCELMGKVKTFSLNLDIKILESIIKNPKDILDKLKKDKVPEYFKNNKDDKKRNYYEIILLAFLDTVGFAGRSSASVDKLFPRVLDRYASTIKYFQEARQKMDLKIGKSKIIQGSALNLPFGDNSVDAVITSPPYSFAIDYLKNDQPQLEYLGYDLEVLRKEMIGLQGRGVENKLEIYFYKMNQTLSEMKRVSKKNSPIVIIIGTNDIQTNGVRLETKVIELGEKQELKFELNLKKPIRGLQNTMKEESILFFTNQK
jgi:tRNA G10  N-methylase Trm11